VIGILHLGSFALYGVASTMLGFSLAREARRVPTIASMVVALALAVHAFALADYTSSWHQLPLVGLGPSLSTLSFLIGLGTLIAATFGHAATVGLVLIPLVAIFTGVAVFVGITPTGDPAIFRGGWGALHVLFALVGLAGLAVASAAGLMYLLQFRELKSKHFGAIFRFFPPLETLDRLGRQGLLVGFPFLTLAVILGWAWTENFQVPTAPGNPKLVWVILSWGVFLAALLARVGQGRKGERGAIASVAAFVVVVVLYVIIRSQVPQTGNFL
jgi:HemX protein